MGAGDMVVRDPAIEDRAFFRLDKIADGHRVCADFSLGERHTEFHRRHPTRTRGRVKTKSLPCWARAAWVRSIAPETRSSGARSPSRSSPKLLPPTPNASRAQHP